MMQDQRLTPSSNNNPEETVSEKSLRMPSFEAVPRENPGLREFLQPFKRRKWFIIQIAFISTLLVALYMFRLPAIYEAQTTIRIEPRNESLLRAKDIVINTGTDPAYRQTLLKLLENPQLLRQLVLTLDLPHRPEFLPSRSSLFASKPRVASSNQPAANETDARVPVTTTDVESLTGEQRAALAPYVDALRANLTFEPIATTNLVNIRFRHTDPALAMTVTDTLARLFIASESRLSSEGTQNASLELANQIADLQIEIRQLQDQRLDYMKNHELPLAEGKGQNLTAERLGALSGELLAAETERKNLQETYESARRSTNPWAVPLTLENRDIQELRKQIRALEQRRASLLVKFTTAWPEVMQVEDEIKRLKKDLDEAPQELLASMRMRYEAALAREESLRRTYFKEHGAANLQSRAQIELRDINQKLETNQQLYNALFQRQKEFELNSSGIAGNVRIDTPSELPLTPVGPPRVKNILITFFLSLVAGMGLAILLYRSDGIVESPEQAMLYTQLPLLAVVPATRKQFLWSRRKEAVSPGAGDCTALALIADGRSPLSEAYRHLRTSLSRSPNTRPPKSILVTSARALEGKTTTAINTAAIFALTGKEVLLVDCDLRRPRLHTHFGLTESPGLSDCLAGKIDVHSAMQSYSRLPNLKIISAGQIPSNPAELLGSDEMFKLLETVGYDFDHIVIDSPPAISFTDAAVLSTMVDGVLIVVRENQSSRKTVKRVEQQLTDIGANICGIILNDAKSDRPEYYDDYYYKNGPRPYEKIETVSFEKSARANLWAQLESSDVEQAFEKFRLDDN